MLPSDWGETASEPPAKKQPRMKGSVLRMLGIRHRSLVGLRPWRTEGKPVRPIVQQLKPRTLPVPLFVKESEPLASGVTCLVQNDYTRAQPIIRVTFLAQSRPKDSLCKPLSSEAIKAKYGPGFEMVTAMGYKGGGLGENGQGLTRPVDGVSFSRWPCDTSGLGAYSYSRYASKTCNEKTRKRTTDKGGSFSRCPPPQGL